MSLVRGHGSTPRERRMPVRAVRGSCSEPWRLLPSSSRRGGPRALGACLAAVAPGHPEAGVRRAPQAVAHSRVAGGHMPVPTGLQHLLALRGNSSAVRPIFSAIGGAVACGRSCSARSGIWPVAVALSAMSCSYSRLSRVPTGWHGADLFNVPAGKLGWRWGPGATVIMRNFDQGGVRAP